MTEIEIGANLLTFLTTTVAVIIGYFTSKCMIKIANRVKNGNTQNT